MRTIQLTITLTRCKSDKSALEIAEGAAEHLLDTFNDDGGLGKTIRYQVMATDQKTTA